MKKIRLTLLALGTAAILPGMMSCSSDRNPFDITTSEVVENATIQLRFNVASTRAESDLTTEDERKISKVSIYIFNESEVLEASEKDIAVEDGTVKTIEVTSGLKTVYAVTAGSGPSVDPGSSISDFEKKLFSSKIENLKTDDGFVMIGKSAKQQVLKSVSENEIPASNIFTIDLVRAVAKAQVNYGELNASAFGFSVGAPEFKACLTNDLMRVVANGYDVIETYVDNDGDGAYNGYSLGKESDYVNAQNSGFTSDGCVYMSENIVNNPVNGNTTYLCIQIPLCPSKYYSFEEGSEYPLATEEAGIEGTTFYAVGIVDAYNGLADYVVDANTKHIITFKDKNQADRYSIALNGGDSSAITVADSETPLSAPATRAEEQSDIQVRQFQTVEFSAGNAYYRVNVGDQDKSAKDAKVERNKFYKIQINSLRTLGYHTEDMLLPQNPEQDIDIQSSAWIETTFNVVEWDEVNQDVDL